MIVRAPLIVTMDGAPLNDGAVRIEGDRIRDVGRFSELGAPPGEEQITEVDGCVLLPGLINAHCHLDYTCLRGKIPPRKSFTDWIRAINAEKTRLTEADYLLSITDGFREAQGFGTMSIVNLEAFPELMARSPPAPIRVWWCAELIDVSAPKKSAKTVAKTSLGIAPHALYSASAELIKRCIEIAQCQHCLLTIHLAEAAEEMEMFRDATGPLYEFLQSLGRTTEDCGGTTPVELFLGLLEGARRDPSTSLRSARDDRVIVAHLNELTESDFDLLKQLPEKFSIAHCPRSHAYFQHSPFAFERLRGLGFNICLATDSLASNTDLSLFAEMREFRKSHPRISAEELLQMVTTNPAKALGRADQLGTIAPGYLADMIALPFAGWNDAGEQIIAFDGEVPWRMIGGEVL
jgi:aminodeoxyfutalosine deaminase